MTNYFRSGHYPKVQLPGPATTKVDTQIPLPTLIQSMPRTDCSDAALCEVARYLRKSQHLTIPEEWLGCFP